MFRAFLTATIAAGIVAISATAFAEQLGTAQEARAAAPRLSIGITEGSAGR